MKSISLYSLLVFNSFCIVVFSLNCSISTNEYRFLSSLFSATNGDSWVWNTSLPLSTRWQFSTSVTTASSAEIHAPCANSWQGITCQAWNTHFCFISQLQLSGFNLRGEIPDQFGDIRNLTVLDLSMNQLRGVIPCSVGNLTSIWTVMLNSNSLTGSIPSSLMSLSSMSYLDLDTNSLIGNQY